MKRIVNILTLVCFSVAMTVTIAIVSTPAIGIMFGSGTLLSALFLPMPKNVLALNLTDNFSARESLQIAAQLLFNSFRNKFGSDAECWEWVWGRKLSPSTVRLEVELNSTNNTFKFGLTEKQNNSNNVQFSTEQRLNQQDTLIVSQYAVYVAQTTGEPDDTDFQLRTYGNFVDFGATNGAVLNRQFYCQGNYNIMVGGDVLIPYRPLKHHLLVPRTQQTAALGAGSPNDEFIGSEDGYITQEANLLLIGNKGYIPQLSFPSNLPFATAEPGIRAILMYDGILAQNSTILS